MERLSSGTLYPFRPTTLMAFSDWLVRPPSLLLCFLLLKLCRVSGASLCSSPPLTDTTIRPTNLPESTSSSSALFSGETLISLPLQFLLFLFLRPPPSSSSSLLVIFCCDWLKLEESGGVGVSSLSDDEENMTGGWWAGLHDEAELEGKTADPGEQAPPSSPPLGLLLFFLTFLPHLLSRESRRRPSEVRAPRRRRRISDR